MRAFIFAAGIFLLATPVYAAPIEQNGNSAIITEKAKVLSVTQSTIKTIPGTNTSHEYQTLSAKILSGVDAGKIVTVENDYLDLSPGDVFFLTHTIPGNGGGYEQYNVSEPDRLPALGGLLFFFVVAVALIGGFTGVRGLAALSVSFFFILYMLLPGILAGYSPTLVAIGVASIIIIFGSYLTHGVNRTTSAAVLGMVGTIFITAGIAWFAISITKLSGFNDESSVYLNFATDGTINFVGLLLGGMLIGILGVLYDAAIGQAVAVEELLRAMPHASLVHVFRRALRIGREHIGALVNTLAIAYAGASLPLLLLFHSYADEPILQTINRELFATEIVRAIVGSIGIVLAVPVATVVALFLLRNHTYGEKPSEHEGPAHHH